MPALRRADARLARTGSSAVVSQNTAAITNSAMAQTLATVVHPNATMTKGAVNFVTAAPTLPTPNTPSAVPCCRFGYQRDT